MKHILGTMKVCTLWDPISFTLSIKVDGGATLQDLSSNVLILVDGTSLTG